MPWEWASACCVPCVPCVSDILPLLCACRLSAKHIYSRLTYPRHTGHATHPSACPCMYISVQDIQLPWSMLKQPWQNCISGHVLIHQEMWSPESSLGMLAVRIGDIDRDAGVLARGVSKEGNEEEIKWKGRCLLGPRRQRLKEKWEIRI